MQKRTQTFNKAIQALVAALLLAMTIAGCSGGGDGGDDSPPFGEENSWDTLVWDRDNWQ